MSRQVEVKLDFINKKGEFKHVKFFMDEQTYEILQDESISEEIRQQYLVEEYHEYERERYHNRKFVSYDYEMAEAFNLIEDTTLSSEEKYEVELNHKEIENAIKQLTPRQQEMVKLIYWEGKTQKELCEIYGVKKQAINDAVRRIHSRLRKILEKNKKI